MNNQSTLKANKWEIFWFLFYFLIPFQGLLFVLKQYFSLERPSLGFYFLIGLASAVIAILYDRWLKKRSVRSKIAGLVIVLAVFFFLYLFLN